MNFFLSHNNIQYKVLIKNISKKTFNIIREFYIIPEELTSHPLERNLNQSDVDNIIFTVSLSDKKELRELNQ